MSRKIQITLAALLFFAVFALAARAEADPPAVPADPPAGKADSALVDRVLDGLETLRASVRTIRADFAQRKVLAMMEQPVETEGQIIFAMPEFVRVEYLRPEQVVMVANGMDVWTYYPAAQRAEHSRIGRYQNVVASFVGKENAGRRLRRHYEIAAEQVEGVYKLVLVPESRRTAKYLKELTLHLRPPDFVPVCVRYVEASGDVIEIRLSNIEINPTDPPVDTRKFVFQPPAGTAVTEIDLKDQLL